MRQDIPRFDLEYPEATVLTESRVARLGGSDFLEH